MLTMTDESGPDAKILAVPIDKLCYDFRGINHYLDMPPILLEQITHFFDHYKDLENNKWVEIDGWEDVAAAKQEILSSIERFNKSPDKPAF